MLNDYMKYAFDELDKAKKQQEICVKKLHEDAQMPLRGSEEAAGYDLYSVKDDVVLPGETLAFPTGIAMKLPQGTFGAIYARSGMAIKRGLRPANCVGVVDSDYRGELIVALHNDSDEAQMIHKGDRIAQLIIQRYEVANMVWVDELDDTQRGTGGFGSTGAN